MLYDIADIATAFGISREAAESWIDQMGYHRSPDGLYGPMLIDAMTADLGEPRHAEALCGAEPAAANVAEIGVGHNPDIRQAVDHAARYSQPAGCRVRMVPADAEIRARLVTDGNL